MMGNPPPTVPVINPPAWSPPNAVFIQNKIGGECYYCYWLDVLIDTSLNISGDREQISSKEKLHNILDPKCSAAAKIE